jgi:hypothetical protein
MEDIRTILSKFHSKNTQKNSDVQKSGVKPVSDASTSEIPDMFFDEVLYKFKLTRPEITLLMFLYRQVWCRPNLYKAHGIGPLNSYTEMANFLHFSNEELASSLRSLETYGLIEIVRAGQYFVRKYFTEAIDFKYGQDYDQFF